VKIHDIVGSKITLTHNIASHVPRSLDLKDNKLLVGQSNGCIAEHVVTAGQQATQMNLKM
jgi:hypothetical protein